MHPIDILTLQVEMAREGFLVDEVEVIGGSLEYAAFTSHLDLGADLGPIKKRMRAAGYKVAYDIKVPCPRLWMTAVSFLREL